MTIGKHKHSSRKNIRDDTIWVPLRDHGLDISASSRTRPEIMGNSSRKRSKVGEVGVGVNGVKIFKYGSFVNGALNAVEMSRLVGE
jgi:hypothetical protein